MFMIYIVLFFLFCGIVFALAAGFIVLMLKIIIGMMILGAIILLPGILFSTVIGLFHKDDRD